jgi:hypothetical protein
MRRGNGGDEKLRPVRVRPCIFTPILGLFYTYIRSCLCVRGGGGDTSVGHGEGAGRGVLDFVVEVLVGELLAVDGLASPVHTP